MVRRAIRCFCRLLPDHPNGPAASVDKFLCNGTRAEDYRPGLGDLRTVACRSKAGLRHRAGPSRFRLAPAHDPVWRWTEFLDGCIPRRFCRSRQLRADRRLAFATEPDHLDFVWRQLMTQSGVGPSSWTDAYLAAFAEADSYSL